MTASVLRRARFLVVLRIVTFMKFVPHLFSQYAWRGRAPTCRATFVQAAGKPLMHNRAV
jgi:hypothetical protein